jgi:chromosome partitioning protein
VPARPVTDRTGGESLAKIVAFTNQKGGVAKTTTTLNIGVAFQEEGYRVLAVDLDPQGNLTMSLGLNPDTVRPSMYDVLVSGVSIADAVHHQELDVAVASIDLAAVEIALSSLIGRERALSKALMQVDDQYDYILIDTPPSLGLLTINALTAADAVIVPVQCEYLSLRGLAQLERTLELVRENLNPRVHIAGIVPTMYDSRTIHGREAVEVLRSSFGDLVFQTTINKTIRFAEAPVRGESVLKYAPESQAAQAYRQLAREVLNGKKI